MFFSRREHFEMFPPCALILFCFVFFCRSFHSTNFLFPFPLKKGCIFRSRTRAANLAANSIMRPSSTAQHSSFAPPFKGIKESHPSGMALFSTLVKSSYFAALAALMASISSGVTLNRSPQMP